MRTSMMPDRKAEPSNRHEEKPIVKEMIPPREECPSASMLARYIAGSGPRTIRKSIGQHVAQCPKCQGKELAVRMAFLVYLGKTASHPGGQESGAIPQPNGDR